MNSQGYLLIFLAAGFVIGSLGASFTFPENDGKRSVSSTDYDYEDRRLHNHHHNQHQHGHHHGGFNKRKKLKKKKKKRPCYYKTSDGRTFFWTGLNIYETNIYVNQAYPQASQGDSVGVGPCESNESDALQTPIGSVQSPPGSFQSPQRPNRPFLQNLATYIPSGPATWSWLQGIHWSNYIPNQHSFSSAFNTVVNTLPGFGPSRPRPPRPPIRPITESTFTRPTEFTRPPTFTRPTQQPYYTTRPTQPPYYTSRPTQPVYTRPTQQPFTRPTQQPAFTRPTLQPIYTRPTSTPPTSTQEGSDENYDYSNFSSENMDNSADTSFNGLGSASNQPANNPASNIPSVGSIGNGIKPVYEQPGKYFNEYIVKPIRGSIREVVSWI